MTSIRDFQKHLDQFRDYYNFTRPHWALDRQTPAHAYNASLKPNLAARSFLIISVCEMMSGDIYPRCLETTQVCARRGSNRQPSRPKTRHAGISSVLESAQSVTAKLSRYCRHIQCHEICAACDPRVTPSRTAKLAQIEWEPIPHTLEVNQA